MLTVDTCGYAHYVQQANAGVVISSSPFNQAEFNRVLQEMLLSVDRGSWSRNGLAFAKTADIYNLAERAADVIEKRGNRKRDILSAR